MDVDIGANPSAEGEDEDACTNEGSTATTAVNVVDAHRLVETSFTKKLYQAHLKVIYNIGRGGSLA